MFSVANISAKMGSKSWFKKKATIMVSIEDFCYWIVFIFYVLFFEFKKGSIQTVEILYENILIVWKETFWNHDIREQNKWTSDSNYLFYYIIFIS